MFERLTRVRVSRWVLVVVSCLAVFVGLVLARWVQFLNAQLLWLLVPFVLVSLRRRSLLMLALLCVLFLGLGWWRGSVYMQKLAVHQAFQMQKVTVVGTAGDEAVYGQRYQLEFTLRNVRILSPTETPLVGDLTVRGFGEPAIHRGDQVEVTGKLYPTRGNALGGISFAELHVLHHDTSWLNNLRRDFAAGMQTALPEPVASFGLGLLIGQRSTLPQNTQDELKRTGLTHIIAVSGYNLTIIVIACRRLLAKRSKYQATVTCFALIGLFILITGSSAPIVRAGIVSALTIGAWYYGRRVKPAVLLCVAAAASALMNPLYIWGNVSWYLSFLAFFGVLVLAPLIAKRFWGEKEPGVLAGIALESACASLMVLPYMLYVFGDASLMSLPANVLVLPLVPLAMLLALVAGLGGMLVPALAGWLAWPAKELMTYMLDAANIFSRVPHAFVSGIGVSFVAMATLYGAIGTVSLALLAKTRHGIITENTREQ